MALLLFGTGSPPPPPLPTPTHPPTPPRQLLSEVAMVLLLFGTLCGDYALLADLGKLSVEVSACVCERACLVAGGWRGWRGCAADASPPPALSASTHTHPPTLRSG